MRRSVPRGEGKGVGDEGSAVSDTCASFLRLPVPDHLPAWPHVSGGWRLSLGSKYRRQAVSSAAEALGRGPHSWLPASTCSPTLWHVCMLE